MIKIYIFYIHGMHPFILTIFLFLSSLFTCSDNHKEKRNVEGSYGKDSSDFTTFKVSGTLLGGDSFYYHDSLGLGHPLRMSENSRILINHPVFVLRADALQAPYWVCPGENIIVSSNDKGIISMRIDGNQTRTNELNFFTQLALETGNLYNTIFDIPLYQRRVNHISLIAVAERQIAILRTRRVAFLNNYTNEKPVSHDFFKLARKVIEAVAISDSLALFINNRVMLKKNGQLESRVIKITKSVNAMEYRPIRLFQRVYDNLVLLAVGKNEIENINDFDKAFDFGVAKMTGEGRDYVLASLLVKCNKRLTLSKMYFDKLMQIGRFSYYVNAVKKALYERKSQDPNKNQMLIAADSGKEENLKIVLSKYEGKVVLLDFWASWCMPCRSEVKFLKQHGKKWRDNGLVIIGVSIDESKSDWLKACQEDGQNLNHQFMVNNIHRNDFLLTHKVMSIPRYMLINRKGQIVNDDFLRPSDSKFSEKVAELLAL